MRKLSYEEILAERPSEEELNKLPKHKIIVILDNIRSTYNVGSIFRTCDSSRIEELLLCGYTPHPPKKELEKTALGALNTVKWQYFKSTNEAIEYAKSKNYKVFAVELTDKKRFYTDINQDEFPLAVVLGNELSGIADNVIDNCDDSMEIPMYGIKHSLNVSVATGIILYELCRKINS
jgi:tRNA G18 (ribose-2'-O)-methylase SpoU